MRQRSALILLLVLLCALPAAASEPYLVKDIDPVFLEGHSSPLPAGSFDKYALFAASTPSEGRELWASDGTPAGTFLVVDSCPGECSGDPFASASTPRGFFFRTSDYERHQTHLWVTRGTPASTVQLTNDLDSIGSATWVESQSLLYFAADNGHGTGLWRTDGTQAGTVEVATLFPNTKLVAFAGRVFFGAWDSVSGYALWVSDGTRAGTRLLKDPYPKNEGSPPRLFRVSSRFLFFHAQGPEGWELWRSDGTPQGTKLAADLVPGPASGGIYDAIAVGNRLFFVAAYDRGQELWVSDGSQAGTRRLTDFPVENPFPTTYSTPFALAAVFGNRLLFAPHDGVHGRELWITDGTRNGTRLLADRCPGSCSGVGVFGSVVQNRLFYSGADSRRGNELWVSDGTPAGTRLVRDICRGSCSSDAWEFTVVGNQLMFLANDGQNGRELWRTDGTAAGTLRLTDIGIPSIPQYFQRIAASGKLFFVADDGVHGEEPWVSDGTREGTRLLGNLNSANYGGSDPSVFGAGAQNLFFFANDGQNGVELWKSDGTEGGTSLVQDFTPGPNSSSRPSPPLIVEETGGATFLFSAHWSHPPSIWRTDGTDGGTFRLNPDDVQVTEGPRIVAGKVFFSATDGVHGDELWVSDGTRGGTRILTDLSPGVSVYGLTPRELTAFRGKLFFTGDSTPDFGSDTALWSSDGTTAGTVSVLEFPKNPVHLTVHQNFLYFFALDQNHEFGVELWRSDGTAAGTTRVADLTPGAYSSGVQAMTSVGSRLFLWDAGPESGPRSLWVSDGTSAGTKPISPVTVGSLYAGLAVLGEVAYFRGRDGAGESLWRSDGTKAGTFPLQDREGHALPPPRSLVAAGGRLYFITVEPATLWQSDGTSAGTFPIRDLETGPEHSLSLAAVGPRVFFSAFHPLTGVELWAIDTRED